MFLLGDNRSLSIDSRSFGAVPTAEIVGRQIVTIGHPGFPLAAATALLLGCLLFVGVGTRAGSACRGPEPRPRTPASA